MKVFDISADKDFQAGMKVKLQDFYEQNFKPAFLDTYLYPRFSKYTFWNDGKTLLRDCFQK